MTGGTIFRLAEGIGTCAYVLRCDKRERGRGEMTSGERRDVEGSGREGGTREGE